jgi:hypothetical protein
MKYALFCLEFINFSAGCWSLHRHNEAAFGRASGEVYLPPVFPASLFVENSQDLCCPCFAAFALCRRDQALQKLALVVGTVLGQEI